jgi:DNA-binding PadR family transcriptional regulator
MHPLEFQVLLVLMDGELHGYGIAKEIENREPGLGRVLPTNLYRRLRDMAAKGMIIEQPPSGDQKRRRFQIKPFGIAVAKAEAERLEALVLSARERRLLPGQVGEG